LMFGQGEMYTSVLPLGVNATPASVPTSVPAPEPTPAAASVPAPKTAPTSTATPATSQSPVGSASSTRKGDEGPDLFSFVDVPQPATAQPAASAQPASAPQLVATQQAASAQPVGVPSTPQTETVAPATPNTAPDAQQQLVAQPQNDQLKENGVEKMDKATGPEYRNLVKEGDKPSRKRIVKVVILYDDHSFSEYYPE